jgi:hypothetical protein
MRERQTDRETEEGASKVCSEGVGGLPRFAGVDMRDRQDSCCRHGNKICHCNLEV